MAESDILQGNKMLAVDDESDVLFPRTLFVAPNAPRPTPRIDICLPGTILWGNGPARERLLRLAHGGRV